MEWFDWIIENWQGILVVLGALIALLEAIFNLTPSEKDNSILLKFKNAISFLFTNRVKGGGKFKTESKIIENEKLE